MTFSLTVLGSSAAIPVKDRHLSAHLLNVNERLFLIDCGEGTQFQLRKFHIPLQRISQILISHLHGDHFFGLIGLLNTMHLLGRKDELHLYAPPDLENIIRVQQEASSTVFTYPLVFHPLVSDELTLIFEDQKVTVEAFPLKHSIPAYGFVFREIRLARRAFSRRSYAYCSDTAYDERVIPFISGVSMLYHETTFMEALAKPAAEKFHSTTIEAATIAKKALAGKLLLGHFSARYDDLGPLLNEARSVFPDSILSAEGITIDI